LFSAGTGGPVLCGAPRIMFGAPFARIRCSLIRDPPFSPFKPLGAVANPRGRRPRSVLTRARGSKVPSEARHSGFLCGDDAMARRISLVLTFPLALLAVLPDAAPAQRPTPKTREQALDAALTYLTAAQAEDGSW